VERRPDSAVLARIGQQDNMPTFVPHFEELYLVYCGAKTIISIYNKQDRLALQLRVKDKIVNASG
jgi:hypothetical protein